MKRTIKPFRVVYAVYLEWKQRNENISKLYSIEKYIRLYCLPKGTGVDWLVDMQAYYEAAHIVDAALRAVKYGHELTLSSHLEKYRR